MAFHLLEAKLPSIVSVALVVLGVYQLYLQAKVVIL